MAHTSYTYFSLIGCSNRDIILYCRIPRNEIITRNISVDVFWATSIGSLYIETGKSVSIRLGENIACEGYSTMDVNATNSLSLRDCALVFIKAIVHFHSIQFSELVCSLGSLVRFTDLVLSLNLPIRLSFFTELVRSFVRSVT